MKFLYSITFLLLLALPGCVEKTSTTQKSKLKLSFNVLPEDLEGDIYSIQWTDTLGQSEGYDSKRFIKRPKEVWCVVTNEKKDTLGYYRGLSTAQDFVQFQSIDTVVILNFMIGLNFFSDKFGDGDNMEAYEKAAQDYSRENRLPVVFKPVPINLRTGLEKQHHMVLEEK